MGYFGPTGFDSDEALDWSSGMHRGVRGSSIRKALESYSRYMV